MGEQQDASYEALVVFENSYDAWLLVEHCGVQDWSSELTPTLHGRVPQVEWPARVPQQGPPDFRSLRHVCRQVDTDASSQISYRTTGTVPSHAVGPHSPMGPLATVSSQSAQTADRP